MNSNEQVKKKRTLACYHKGIKIGEGSFGCVYLAIDNITKEEVALKEISKEKKSSRDMRNLRKENELLMGILHENVIRGREYYEDQTKMVIVMDYAPSDLAKLLKQKRRLSLGQIKNIARQILSAMLYLKLNSILHRDLKPQNILLKGDQVKLCDFGFAKKMSASVAFLQSMKGTPLYIAPQILKQQPYDSKVDVWSFGIILYELFMGVPPFLANTVQKLRPKIQFQKVMFPERMPVQLRELIDGMLQKAPSRRYTWQQVRDHVFFNQENNIEIKDNIVIPKQMIQVVVQKIDLPQLQKIQAQLQLNKTTELKTNIAFYHKVIAVLGQACLKKINPQIIQKTINILTYLITKVPPQKDDITKQPQLMTALITLAQKQQPHPSLLQLLGFMLKNNFDGTKLDIENMEQIMDMLHEVLKKPLSPKKNSPVNKDYEISITLSVTLFGIMANQAVAVPAQSQQFFTPVVEDKILLTICAFYPRPIIIQCLEKYLHPMQQIPIKTVKLLQTLRQQTAQALFQKGIFNQIDQNFTFTQAFAKVLFECVQINQEVRKAVAKDGSIFLKNQLLNGKRIVKLYCLAINDILLKQQNIKIFTKEIIDSFLTTPSTDNKLVNVYLVRLATCNLLSKKNSSNDNGNQNPQYQTTAQNILLRVFDLLKLEQTIKSKCSCELVCPSERPSQYFDALLLGVVSDITQDLGLGCLDSAKNIIDYVLGTLQLGEKGLSQIFKIPQVVEELKEKHCSILFKYLIAIVKKWKEKGDKKMVQGLLRCVVGKGLTREEFKQLLKIFEQHNFYRVLFGQNIRSQITVLFGLQILNSVPSKPQSKQALLDYIALQVFPLISQMFHTKNPDLQLQLIKFSSLLAITKHEKALQTADIVRHARRFLIEGNQVLKQRTIYLIGNLSKPSALFFQQFQQFKIVTAIHTALFSHPNNMRMLKSAIFATGNISFYGEKFADQIRPMLKLFLSGLQCTDDDYFLSNTLSAISNLIRYSGNMIKDLIDCGVMTKVLQIAKKGGDFALKAVKKALVYQYYLNWAKIQLKDLYQQQKNNQDQCIKKLKEIFG